MLYQHAPRAIPFQIIGASIVVVALRAEISANWLSLWWLILTGLTVYRIWYVHRSKRLVDDQQTTVSLQIHFLGVVATGLTWGAGYLFFISQSSIEHQAMLIMVLAGITAGGLVASYGVKHHFFGFLFPALGAPTLYGLYDGERIQIWISVLIIVFVIALIIGFLRYARAIHELIDTRLENSLLVESLSASNRELEQSNEQLLELSSTDGLTQVANRRHFDNQLQREWGRAQRSGNWLSYLMVDIDFFKPYNDHYGHLKGDDCLKEVAQALQGVLRRPGDFVGRYGGEEFAILSPDTPPEGAMILAQKVRAVIEELNIPHRGSPVSGHVSVSVGVTSTKPSATGSVNDLIHTADRGLYEAKHHGRNRVEVSQFVAGAAT